MCMDEIQLEELIASKPSTAIINKPFAILEFVNTTPLWPGGPYYTKTYECSNLNLENCIGPFLPTSQQLIGRMRWLLRLVEASLKNIPNASYRNVEELNTIIFGNLEKSGTVLVRTNYYFTGTHDLIPYDAPYLPQHVRDDINFVKTSDLAVLDRLLNVVKDIKNLISVLEIHGYLLMRRSRGLHKHKLTGGIAKLYENTVSKMDKQLSQLSDICKLLAIPRFRLAMQGIKNIVELYEYQPLRPEKVRLKVELYLKTGASSSAFSAQAKRTVKKFVILLATHVLTFIGLGKAVSRGFGKFRLELYELDKDLKGDAEVEQILESLKNGDKGLGNMFREASEALIRSSLELLKNISAPTLSYQATEGLSRIPTLNYAIKNSVLIDPLKHPCVYVLQELPNVDINKDPCINNKFVVTDIIEALSAIGKATLKSTWKVKHGDIRNPGVAYHTWALGLPRGAKQTGYYTYENKLNAEMCEIPRDKEEPRRLSPLVFVPYCMDGRCEVLLIPFVTINDFAAKINNLIHVGGHKCKDVKHLGHVIVISHALRNSKSGKVPGELMGIAKYNQKPGTPCQYADITMCVEEALNTALEWVKNLLG